MVAEDSAGSVWSFQSYDWKGRPTVTTNQGDASTKTMSYGGCGCAGGEVVTQTDEVGRKQKIYSDVLGRTVKAETYNSGGATVYSTTVNSYNARDQVMQVRQYAGSEGSGSYQDTTMSYDGYGRLQSKHTPEQNLGTALTYNYNPDDTVQSVTDARGVTTTFAYNGRHLLTSVVYPDAQNLPSGVTPTANASFAYDGAGNRTGMSDGSGSCNYNYDQLSRMTSETHTFIGLSGSYTLSYGYNISGQLTSIAEPSQFGMGAVTYAHDGIGRLTNVAGLLTGIQYRASGAMKHANYADGAQLNVSYNDRMLPTRYEFSNLYLSSAGSYTTMGSANQYYADGRLHYAQDLQDGNFDRAYDYDHAGRIKEAYSGREARGLPPLSNPDNPFRQSYSYDVWNNMGRTGKHWSAPVSDTPGYTNNRRADWNYDANGQVTSSNSVEQHHTYDAANQQTSYSEAGSTSSNLHWLWHQYTINQIYNGSGQADKRVETRESLDDLGTYESHTDTRYNLRSTVLGGAVIARLDQAGNRDEGHIYVGGEILADNFGQGPNPYTSIQHTNPTTGNWVKHEARTELDPLGADVGATNPYVSNLSYADIMGAQPLFERGNPFDQAGGCGLGSMPIPCSMMMYAMNASMPLGSSVGSSSLMMGWVPGMGPGPMVDLVPEFEDWLEKKGRYVNQDNLDQLGHEWVEELMQNLERRLTKDETGAIRGEVAAMLANDKCKTFIENLLAAAGKETGGTYSPNILDNFDAVSRQGGFHAKYLQVGKTASGAPIYAGGDQPGSPVGEGRARINFNPNNIANMNRGNNIIYVALTALHEVIHASGAGFNDSTLAIAVAKMRGLTPPKRATNMDEILDRGREWNQALSDSCLVWRSGFTGGKKK